MSQFPNQPGLGGPGSFGQGPNPYQPPPKSNAWLWILLGVGGVVLLGCCGCGGLMYLGFNVLGSELTARLNADPVAQEHLGTVSSVQMDIMATGKEGEKNPGKSFMVFDVVGSKGTGEVVVEQSPGPEQFKNGKLRINGQEFQLGF